MKQFFIIIILFCSISLFANDAKEKVQITGKPIECAGINAKEIRNILFLKERADLQTPKKIFLFQLNDISAEKMGKDKIWVIPINEFQHNNSTLYNVDSYNNMSLNRDKDFTIEIYPVTDFNGSLYYSKDNALLNTQAQKKIESQKKFWQKPQNGDTIASHLFSGDKDFRNTILKIRQLENNALVVNEFEVSEYLIDKIQGRQYDSIVVHKMPATVKDVALSELSELHFLDDFRPPKNAVTKKEWMKWYSSLPQPHFDKPEIKTRILQIPYSENEIDGFSSRMFQNEEKRLIYSLSSKYGYVLDTENDIVTSIDSTLFSFFNAPIEVNNNYGESDSSMKIKDEWLRMGESVNQSKTNELANGDIIIGSIQSNKFQNKFYIYKISKGSEKSYKEILFHSVVPLEEYSIVGIFEAHGKYYFVFNTSSSPYANIAIIEDSIQ